MGVTGARTCFLCYYKTGNINPDHWWGIKYQKSTINSAQNSAMVSQYASIIRNQKSGMTAWPHFWYFFFTNIGSVSLWLIPAFFYIIASISFAQPKDYHDDVMWYEILHSRCMCRYVYLYHYNKWNCKKIKKSLNCGRYTLVKWVRGPNSMNIAWF